MIECERISLAPVHRASLHFAAWGTVRAAVAGVTVNADFLDPTDSSLRRATSRSYDVTDLVAAAAGPIRVELVAGLGHYRKVLDRPRLIAMLRVDYADGAVQTIGTSGEWQYGPTSLVQDEPFYLEAHDARRADRPVAGSVTVVAADSTPPPPDLLVPNIGPSVRIVRRVHGSRIGDPDDDVQVFDLGENIAGRVRLDLRGTVSGQSLESVQGEKLTAAGRVDTTNIRLPDDRDRERQVFRWVCAGDDEIAEPWFGVQGFRYIEVRGAGSASVSVSAGVLHSDVERTGSVVTAVPELTKLVDMAVRTQLNNVHGYPEDCPSREQGGWTGDASASAEAALSHLDLTGVYRNWLADVALDMTPSGGVPGLSPIVLAAAEQQPADPVWGSAMTEIPWQMWRSTGDASLIASLMPAMRRWADWQIGTLEDGVVRRADISFGADWLALEQTPPVLLQTAAVAVSLRQLAELEDAAGTEDSAAARRAQADAVVLASRSTLHDPETGVWANASQASTALAITTGLAERSEVPLLESRLLEQVRLRHGRLASGFAGTKAVVRALAGIDGGSVLLDAVRQPEQPGIGAMLVDGPGTFWETWWIDDENVGVASLDHIGLAAPFAAWVWQDVVGLKVLEPGFRRFALEPGLVREVPSASFVRQTVRGELSAEWSFRQGAFRCGVRVPVGAVAEIVIPGESDAVTVDGGTSRFATIERRGGNRTVVVLSAGEHVVTADNLEFPARPQRPPTVPSRPAGQWLSDGAESRWSSTRSGTLIARRDDTVVCTPVFHEPIPGPTLDVQTADLPPEVDDLLVLEQNGPLDLSAARTVYAHFDLDNAPIPGRRFAILLQLVSADGTIARAQARPLPIQWNRVALDVGEWAGRAAVTAVQVGVRWVDEPDPARGPFLPLSPSPRPFFYRLGRVGWSDAPPTY